MSEISMDLEKQLRHVIDSFIKCEDMTYSDLIGTLEHIKLGLFLESRGLAGDDKDE